MPARTGATSSGSRVRYCVRRFHGGASALVEENARRHFRSAELCRGRRSSPQLSFCLFSELLLGIGNYLSTYFVEWVGNRVVMDLRTELFAHIHQLPLLYFSQSKTGELISRTTNDTLQIERAVSTVMIDLVREPFVLMASMGYLFWLDARLALLSLVLFPVCIVPVALFGRRVRRFAREGQQKLADMMSMLQETITGVKIVKAYGMEERESRRFAEQAKAVFSRVMKVTRASAAIDPIVVSISFAGLSLALVYARWIGMSFDQFFTFGAALVMMYQPVKKISKLNMAIQQGSGAADRIFELRDAPVVQEVEGAVDFDEPVRTIEFVASRLPMAMNRSCATSGSRSPPANASPSSAVPVPARAPS